MLWNNIGNLVMTTPFFELGGSEIIGYKGLQCGIIVNERNETRDRDYISAFFKERLKLHI
jgi:hypothetical protein